MILRLQKLNFPLDMALAFSNANALTHPQVDDNSYGEYMEVKFQITATYEYDYLCF